MLSLRVYLPLVCIAFLHGLESVSALWPLPFSCFRSQKENDYRSACRSLEEACSGFESRRNGIRDVEKAANRAFIYIDQLGKDKAEKIDPDCFARVVEGQQTPTKWSFISVELMNSFWAPTESPKPFASNSSDPREQFRKLAEGGVLKEAQFPEFCELLQSGLAIESEEKTAKRSLFFRYAIGKYNQNQERIHTFHRTAFNTINEPIGKAIEKQSCCLRYFGHHNIHLLAIRWNPSKWADPKKYIQCGPGPYACYLRLPEM